MARQWCPECHVDEYVAAMRDSPTAWLVQLEGKTVIAGTDDYPPVAVAPGDVVEFAWYEAGPVLDVTIKPDGTWACDRDIPADATHFWEQGDNDTLAYSIDDFARTMAEGIGAKHLPERIEVSTGTWGDQFFRLVDGPSGPVFKPVEPQA